MVVVTNGCQDKGEKWNALHLGRIYVIKLIYKILKEPEPQIKQTNKV